jgi:hypothetical protein
VLGILAILAALGVWVWDSQATRGADQFGASQGWDRASVISWSLFLLATACSVMLVPYHEHFERPGRAEPWPTTWQTQLTAALALAALPLWSLVFALLVPPRPSLSNVMNALQILALLLLIAAHVWMIHRAYE